MSSRVIAGLNLGYNPILVGVGGIKLPSVLEYSTISIISSTAKATNEFKVIAGSIESNV